MKKPSCIAPWITTYDHIGGGIQVCCEANKILIPNKEKRHMSFEERFTHPEMEKFKKIMVESDELPPMCTNCISQEQKGSKSLRQEFNEDYLDDTWQQDKFVLRYLDYRESNLCNFSCKMCGSYLSSTHAKIEGKHGKTGVLNNVHKLEQCLDNLHTVEHVSFAGGEPLMTKSFYDICKKIKELGREKEISISMVTNGSVLNRHGQDVLETIDGFADVGLSISIDCIEDQHDYWRHKGTWNTVFNNLKEFHKFKLANPKAVRTKIRTAISWPNAYAARDVFDNLSQYVDKMRHNFVTNPPGLSIDCLPKEHLDKLIEHWKDYPEVQVAFKNVVPKEDLYLYPRKFMLERHDKYHGNSFEKAFPEFADFYKSIVHIEGLTKNL